MNYNHFNSYSMKARISWAQKVLGLEPTGKRDKTTIKAIKEFQESHGLTGNAFICEKTFNLLDSYSNHSVRMERN